MGSWNENEKDRSIGALAINITELKEALLSRIEAMESAVWEAKSTVSHDEQPVEELKDLQGTLTAKIQELEYQKEGLSVLLGKHNIEFITLKSDTETKVGKLGSQLQQMEVSLRAKESAISQLQEDFTAQIQELEHRLTKNEQLSGLLDKSSVEFMTLRSASETRVGKLESQLQQMEVSLRAKESAISQLQENFTAKVQELEQQKENLSGLLDKHNVENKTLRSDSEARIGMLEAQLQEKEETLLTKESAISQLQENFTAKVQELEQQKENLSGLLDKQQAEIRSQAEAKVGMLEAQLRETEESLTAEIQELEHRLTEKEGLSGLLDKQQAEIRSQAVAEVGMLEAQLRETEESLTAEIQELEHRLAEKEGLSGLLAKQNDEFATLRSDTEMKLGKMESQLQELEETLHKKESAIVQLEESLTAEIQELEDQLTEKESLLETRQEELSGLRSKLDSFGNGSDGVLTLREEDVVNINLSDHKGEKAITPYMGEEKMAQDLKDTATETERLRAQIQERDTMLTAKETEVKMINRTMEEEVSRQLFEKEESTRTRESAAKRQEDILTARIHDLENRLREKEALLEEGEGKDRQQSMSDELESLKDELRDKNLLLQARETEVRMIKQSLNEKFRGLERIAQNPAGKDLKKSRLGSFLETIEKKN